MLPSDPITRTLLDRWQRGLPMVPRPFAEIGETLNLTEAQILLRIGGMLDAGVVGRVGAICRPNTIAASTLAAMRVPSHQVREVAALIGEEPGVNHSYERTHDWNLWFVATAPHRSGVDACLARIGQATGHPVLDLRLVTPYHIDLGFPLDGRPEPRPQAPPPRLDAIQPGDREIVQALCRGLPIVARPWDALGAELGMAEAHVIERAGALLDAGILTRIGLIVRHRPLGWRANAMTVWQVPTDRIDSYGQRLAAQPGVTLCYRRRPEPDHWPFNLYCMVHGRSRKATLEALEKASAEAGLDDFAREILFSTRCFRQRGALVADQGAAA